MPEFQAAYREARRAAFGQAVGRLQQACSVAVTTLLEIMVDPNAPASARVRAADSVLDHTARALELEDLEARIADLERAQANPMMSDAVSEVIDVSPEIVPDDPGTDGQ